MRGRFGATPEGGVDLRHLLPHTSPDRCQAELDGHRIMERGQSGGTVLRMLCDLPRGHKGNHSITIAWPQ